MRFFLHMMRCIFLPKTAMRHTEEVTERMERLLLENRLISKRVQQRARETEAHIEKEIQAVIDIWRWYE